MATIGDSGKNIIDLYLSTNFSFFCLVRDLREDIPLKSGIRNSKLCDCSEECLGGSKFINCAFGSLTLIITVALLVQIYYGDYQVRFRIKINYFLNSYIYDTSILNILKVD